MMTRISVLMLAAAAALMMTQQAQAAETLTVDPVHSSVVFRIEHMNAAPVFGRFNGKSGKIVLDTANPSNSSVDFTIDPASVDTGNERRDGHLMSPDFFSAKEFPEISFKSKSVSRSGEGQWNVTGMLDIHGVSKEVTLQVRYKAGGENGDVHGFYIEHTINRMDFNVGPTFPPSALSHDVQLYIGIEAKAS